jgi:hypothetical protein
MVRRAQPDLFEVPAPSPATPGSMDFRASVSLIVTDALAHAHALMHKDRFAVAADMSRLAGKDISKWMLDGYTSEARDEFNVPAYLIPALEVATGSSAYTQWLAATRGARVLFGREVLHHDLSRLQMIRDQADDAIRAIKQQVARA